MIASGLLPASRRPNPCPQSSKPFLDMSHLPAGARRLHLAPNYAATQETRSSRALFPKNKLSRSVPFPAPIVHFNAPDQWSRARRYWARVDHDVYFKLEPAARRSSAMTYSECRLEMPTQLIRFRNLTRAGQPIAERVNIHLKGSYPICGEVHGITAYQDQSPRLGSS
jgi:hypothetical protein